jgi:hypothetical protein
LINWLNKYNKTTKVEKIVRDSIKSCKEVGEGDDMQLIGEKIEEDSIINGVIDRLSSNVLKINGYRKLTCFHFFFKL